MRLRITQMLSTSGASGDFFDGACNATWEMPPRDALSMMGNVRK